MPLSQRWTLTRYLIEERRRFPQASGDLNALILDVSIACKAIARIVAYGALDSGMAVPAEGGAVNVQGEVQKPLDVLSNEIFLHMNEWNGELAGMASEEMDSPSQIPQVFPRGKYLLVRFEPDSTLGVVSDASKEAANVVATRHMLGIIAERARGRLREGAAGDAQAMERSLHALDAVMETERYIGANVPIAHAMDDLAARLARA